MSSTPPSTADNQLEESSSKNRFRPDGEWESHVIYDPINKLWVIKHTVDGIEVFNLLNSANIETSFKAYPANIETAFEAFDAFMDELDMF